MEMIGEHSLFFRRLSNRIKEAKPSMRSFGTQEQISYLDTTVWTKS